MHLDYVGKVTQSASSDNGFEKGDCKNLLTRMDVFYLVFLYVFINQNVVLIVTLLFFKTITVITITVITVMFFEIGSEKREYNILYI